ncbi:hypothetical protein B0H13DRAFT_2095918, partial [Mycena leptocephala]
MELINVTVAVFLCCMVLSLLVAQMVSSRPSMASHKISLYSLGVTVWTNVTITSRWGRNTNVCGLFTSANILVWLLIVVLFRAAYATYRCAIKIHGATMVLHPTPP